MINNIIIISMAILINLNPLSIPIDTNNTLIGKVDTTQEDIVGDGFYIVNVFDSNEQVYAGTEMLENTHTHAVQQGDLMKVTFDGEWITKVEKLNYKQ